MEARIAQIIKNTETVEFSDRKFTSPRRHNKYSFETRPYNDNDEEAVMDDEELHSLLGV